MCRGTFQKINEGNSGFTLTEAIQRRETSKNQRNSAKISYANNGTQNCEQHQNAHSLPHKAARSTSGMDPPKFEVYFNPTIPDSAGSIQACKEAVFESFPAGSVTFVCVCSAELRNMASHIVIRCVELDGIPLVENGIAPCEIIRMEQRLMNCNNSTWCLAFRGLVALKAASRLKRLRQMQHSKGCSPQSSAANLQCLEPAPVVEKKKEQKGAQTVFRPKARKNPIFGFSQDDVRNSYTRQIDKMYKRYCPQKRSSVPMLLKQYEGREEYLLNKVKAKYCNSQHARRPPIHV